MRNLTEEKEFNCSPPLTNCESKYMVLKNKENGVMFWTSGGEYRNDWYEMVFESDDKDEVMSFYMSEKHNKK